MNIRKCHSKKCKCSSLTSTSVNICKLNRPSDPKYNEVKWWMFRLGQDLYLWLRSLSPVTTAAQPFTFCTSDGKYRVKNTQSLIMLQVKYACGMTPESWLPSSPKKMDGCTEMKTKTQQMQIVNNRFNPFRHGFSPAKVAPGPTFSESWINYLTGDKSYMLPWKQSAFFKKKGIKMST